MQAALAEPDRMSARLALALALTANLADPHRDVERLAAAAKAGAADGRGAEIIQTDRDADMGVGRADAIGCVKGDPTEVRYVSLGPGVAGLLIGHTVVALEMAADVASRNPNAPRRRDEDMREVLAHAALQRE